MRMRTHVSLALATLLLWAGAANGQSPDFSKTKAAAETGNAEAQNDLARMYHLGVGTTQDLHAAVTWYRRAIQPRSLLC